MGLFIDFFIAIVIKQVFPLTNEFFHLLIFFHKVVFLPISYFLLQFFFLLLIFLFKFSIQLKFDLLPLFYHQSIFILLIFFSLLTFSILILSFIILNLNYFFFPPLLIITFFHMQFVQQIFLHLNHFIKYFGLFFNYFLFV